MIGAKKMRSLARFISRKINGLGFVLFVFPNNEAGFGNYISNVNDRQKIVQALKSIISQFEKNEDFDTPEEN